MKNLDMMQQKRAEIVQALSNAIAANDEKAVQQSLESLSGFYSEIVTAQINGAMEDADRTILAGRGVRQLTSKETKFYEAVIQASRSATPKQAIANIDIAFPETIIDTVMEDAMVESPLLNAIDFQNTSNITHWIINEQGPQKAVWGALGLNKNSTGVSELVGDIAEFNVAYAKLFAYMTTSIDLMDAGPAWIARYIRSVLTEALTATA